MVLSYNYRQQVDIVYKASLPIISDAIFEPISSTGSSICDEQVGQSLGKSGVFIKFNSLYFVQMWEANWG